IYTTYKREPTIVANQKLREENIRVRFEALKVARAVTFEGKNFTLDYPLEELMKNLDPGRFYRVNRQYIVAHRAISDLSLWFGGKLSVNLSVPAPERIVVSKPRVGEFKAW
ncbi:MAG: LytTR family transcriptional regulator, partial [Rikenellaceae bacterium]|nr:LytTR family transcriptional regulator [Rikenellaceae bacterium]